MIMMSLRFLINGTFIASDIAAEAIVKEVESNCTCWIRIFDHKVMMDVVEFGVTQIVSDNVYEFCFFRIETLTLPCRGLVAMYVCGILHADCNTP